MSSDKMDSISINQSSQEDLHKTSTYLETVTEHGPGIKILLRGEKAVIGRNIDAEICVNSFNVSRNHACIELSEDMGWNITDTESINGVYVNEYQLKPSHPFMLDDGAIISLGPPSISKHKFVFHKNSVLTMNEAQSSDGGKLALTLCKMEESIPGCSNSFENPNDITTELNISQPENSLDITSVTRCLATSENELSFEEQLHAVDSLLKINDAIDTRVKQLLSGSDKQLPQEEDKKPVKECVNTKELQDALNAEFAKQFGKIMEKELTCSICTEWFIKATTLQCAHTFCADCLQRWKQTRKVCPICRAPIFSTAPTLVVDGIIDRMVEWMSSEDQAKRNAVVQERILNSFKKKGRTKRKISHISVNTRTTRARFTPPADFSRLWQIGHSQHLIPVAVDLMDVITVPE